MVSDVMERVCAECPDSYFKHLVKGVTFYTHFRHGSHRVLSADYDVMELLYNGEPGFTVVDHGPSTYGHSTVFFNPKENR